jgi:hypothetical protein
VAQARQRVTGHLREGEYRGVVADIIVSPQSILAGKNIVVQARPLLENNEHTGRDELKGEMNKIKPPMFDGEHKKEEDVETWLLGMRKYFNCRIIPLMQKEEL